MSSPRQEYALPGQRIVVVGVSGCGKTTTAQRLSKILGLPHVELDALHWQPNWMPAETEHFRAQVRRELAAPAWVVDGNYSKARDIVWGSAATLVWLDYSLPVILYQLMLRTFRRVGSHQVLWNDNRETWRGVLFSKDSLFLWALSSYPRMRQEYPELLAQPEYAHLQVIHLHSHAETRLWLEKVQRGK